jgi:hypothetical protein
MEASPRPAGGEGSARPTSQRGTQYKHSNLAYMNRPPQNVVSMTETGISSSDRKLRGALARGESERAAGPGPSNSALIEEEIEGVEKDVPDGQRTFDWSILALPQLILPQRFLDDKGPFETPRRHDQHRYL